MIFKDIEFDKVKKIISLECHSVLGSELTESLSPLKNKAEIEQRLILAEESQILLREGISYNFTELTDISKLLLKFHYENYNYEEFTQIYYNLNIANQVRLDENYQELAPQLFKKISAIKYLEKLTERYQQIFDADGNVKDNASTKLAQVRRRKRSLRKNIVGVMNKRADQLYTEHKSYDNIVTQRDGRYMIPVKEGAVTFEKGIVHGRSASRASVYLEPAEIVQQNNELDILSSDEKLEIKRIFVDYSQTILVHKEQILANDKILKILDYYFAVGRFSNRMAANIPKITDELKINLIQARHPLLIEAFGSVKKVIPFSLNLGDDFKLLVISGPNTGGKTVTLKSVGLLTIMTLSGLPIPADKESEIGIYHSFFADIGDQQSLEDSLSTFSSHIKNINEMIQTGDEKSLILIDEIGAATDPEQGSALAQAVLEKLTSLQMNGVITTHYTALKVFAEQHDNCINASMQFDPELHTPTYSFKLGLPGNSFAIEVARNLGFDAELISRARALTGSQNVELTELITKMSEEKKALAKQKYRYELNNALLKLKIAEQQRKIDELEDSKKSVRQKSLKDARDYLTQLQKELNNEISSIKQIDKKQRKEKFTQSLNRVNQLNRELGQKASALAGKEESQIEDPQIGQRVWVNNFDAEGEIVQINANSAKIDMDGIFFTVDQRNLFEPRSKKQKKNALQSNHVGGREFRTELKLLGFIFDEARPEIDKFIDDAVINSLQNIRVVHGKGTGALRSKVRQYLRKNKKVDSFQSAEPNVGGDGVTVVSLKI